MYLLYNLDQIIPDIVEFPPYTENEIYNILSSRIEKIKTDRVVFDPPALRLLSKNVSV